MKKILVNKILSDSPILDRRYIIKTSFIGLYYSTLCGYIRRNGI